MEIRNTEGTAVFQSGYLEGVYQYVLGGLPQGFYYEVPYEWEVYIWGGNGYGRSLKKQWVTFAP